MKAISLYSGAGGLDEGLIKAGFKVVFANDSDKNACKTYKENHGDHIECGDIDLIKNELVQFQNEIDLIAGGPPCQGFSVAGKMDPDDPRSKFKVEEINAKINEYESKSFFTYLDSIFRYSKVMLFKINISDKQFFVDSLVESANQINAKQKTKEWIQACLIELNWK